MRLPLRATAALLPLLLLPQGCRHRPVVVAAIPPPVPTISVPPPTHRTESLPPIALEEPSALATLLARRPLPRFRPKPTTARQLALLLPPAPQPVPLGALTTGGEAENDALRRSTADLLRLQHQRLNSMPPMWATMHGQQLNDAKFFLQSADVAWNKLDLEGARTLATKAKVLLDEL